MNEPTAKATRFGPLRKDWVGIEPRGACSDCGGQCAPECGTHPAGCIYGGFTESSGYWMIAEGCPLFHGENNPRSSASSAVKTPEADQAIRFQWRTSK